MAELVSESGKMILGLVMSGAFETGVNALNIKSQLKDLPKMMSSIEVSLLDPDSMELNPAQIELLKQLRCAVENMADFEDERETRAKRRKITSTTSNLTQKVFFYFHALKDATRQVTSIWKDLGPLAREKEEVHNLLCMLSKPQGFRNSESLMETAPCIRSEEVIGRDGDRDKILSMLGSTDTLSVLPITGIGGIGKTTLAQHLYSSEIVKTNFDVMIWVCVGQIFHFKEVIRKMAEFAKNEGNLDGCELAQLQKCILPVISDKKCFMVIDNVWDHRGLSFNWQELWKTLGFVGAGSRCIVTTRSESVARTLSNVDPYRLGDLEAQDAWRLFRKLGFRKQQLEPELEGIGWEIAQLCGNVPLVIRVIGSLLKEKSARIVDWSNFRDDLARRRSCGDCESDVTQILKLSYDHLHPEGLKCCFLFFSLFNKGFFFPKDDLIYLWRALGFVKTHENQSEVITAEEYFTCLKNRGLLFHHPFGVGMHDVIHDLVVSLAKSNYKMVDSDECNIGKETRHVWFRTLTKSLMEDFPCPSLIQIKDKLQSLLIDVNPSFMQIMVTLHSCLTYNRWEKKGPINLNFEMLSQFKRLRVFSLPNAGLKEVPSSLANLIHLRYLDLSNNFFTELPDSITQLVNLLFLRLWGCDKLDKLPTDLANLVDLEYLGLSRCTNLKELPRDIGEMEKLRHLELLGCNSLKHMPSGLGKLTSLEELSLFKVRGQDCNDEEVGGLAELNPLNNLEGHLEIVVDGRWSSPLKAKGGNLQAKEKLESVRIEFKEGTNADSEVLEGLRPPLNLRSMNIYGYKGERPPSWIDDRGCILNLWDLKINGWERFSCLDSFVSFPGLGSLTVSNCKNMEYIESSTADPSAPSSLFPNLKNLCIESMPKLKGWSRSRSLLGTNGGSIFPKLKSLSFGLMDFEVVPEEFRSLPLLVSLRFRHCKQLKEIPEWIETFPSLRVLGIEDCPTLMSLPKQIANLTNLDTFEIRDCPNLEERCRRQTGENWPLIQHIPCINFYNSK